MSNVPVVAGDVQSYLRQLSEGWIDPENTVDTMKFGDLDAAVEGIAVAWMCTTDAVREASTRGCTLFITHEPTLYTHEDQRNPDLPEPAREQTASKCALIEDLGMTVIRCHDFWDQYPSEGVPDSWSRHLFPNADIVESEGFFRVIDRGTASSAEDIAAGIATRTTQTAVQLLGPVDATVERVCVGTGAATPFPEMWRDCDADLYVCSDDGFTYWQDGALATDAGVPVVVVNHATSEEQAMASLAANLDQRFDVPVRHLEQGCQYKLIGSME